VAENLYARRLPRKVEEIYATLGEPIAIKHKERLAVERERKARQAKRYRIDLPPATFMSPTHLEPEMIEQIAEQWRLRRPGQAVVLDAGLTVTYAPQRPKVRARRGPTPRWLRR
jgi:hypothetical protein